MPATDLDQYLAELRGQLDQAPSINDLDVRQRWLRIVASRAVMAIAYRNPTESQRQALQALRQLAVRGADDLAQAQPQPAEV